MRYRRSKQRTARTVESDDVASGSHYIAPMHRVPYADLEFRDVMRRAGEPFTGIAFDQFDDGKLAFEIAYEQGIQSGPSREYFDDGRLATECTMRHGTFHGIKRAWHDTGQLAEETEYHIGLALRRKRWDESGAQIEDYAIEHDPAYAPGSRLILEYRRLMHSWTDVLRVPNDSIDYNDDAVYCLDDKPFTGIGFALYDGGWLESECGYLHGQKSGIERSWFSPDQLEYEAALSWGVIHGKERRWYQNGQLEEETDVDRAIVLRRTQWDRDGNVVETYVIDEAGNDHKSLEQLRTLFVEPDDEPMA